MLIRHTTKKSPQLILIKSTQNSGYYDYSILQMKKLRHSEFKYHAGAVTLGNEPRQYLSS